MSAAAMAADAKTAPAQRVNFLFIVVDDLKTLLGVYGDRFVHSPGVDRLAARGILFDNSYCQQSVCGPSRASTLSGLRPDSSGVTNLQVRLRDMAPGVLTLPQYLRQKGWHTVSIGKVYHHIGEDTEGWSEEEYRDPDASPGYADPANKALLRRHRREGGSRKKKSGPPVEAFDGPDESYADARLAGRAIAKLKDLKKGPAPFFLAVGFHKPHLPFAVPKRYWDLYERGKLPFPAWVTPPKQAPEIAMQPGWELRSYAGVPSGNEPIGEGLARELIHGYYASVSYVDAQIGRLVQALDDEGLTSSTVIVLFGDHGWHLGDHGIWCKHTNFEQATKAPLILVDPRRVGAAGKRSPAMVEFSDIYPTLVQLAGLPVPAHVEGNSLQPLLEQPERPWKKASFSQFPRRRGAKAQLGRTLRTARYRYTQWTDVAGTVVSEELYDYEKDPLETQSLHHEPAYRVELGSLRETMAQGWRGARPQD